MFGYDKDIETIDFSSYHLDHAEFVKDEGKTYVRFFISGYQWETVKPLLGDRDVRRFKARFGRMQSITDEDSDETYETELRVDLEVRKIAKACGWCYTKVANTKVDGWFDVCMDCVRSKAEEAGQQEEGDIVDVPGALGSWY